MKQVPVTGMEKQINSFLSRQILAVEQAVTSRMSMSSRNGGPMGLVNSTPSSSYIFLTRVVLNGHFFYQTAKPTSFHLKVSLKEEFGLLS